MGHCRPLQLLILLVIITAAAAAAATTTTNTTTTTTTTNTTTKKPPAQPDGYRCCVRTADQWLDEAAQSGDLTFATTVSLCGVPMSDLLSSPRSVLPAWAAAALNRATCQDLLMPLAPHDAFIRLSTLLPFWCDAPWKDAELRLEVSILEAYNEGTFYGPYTGPCNCENATCQRVADRLTRSNNGTLVLHRPKALWLLWLIAVSGWCCFTLVGGSIGGWFAYGWWRRQRDKRAGRHISLSTTTDEPWRSCNVGDGTGEQPSHLGTRTQHANGDAAPALTTGFGGALIDEPLAQ